MLLAVGAVAVTEYCPAVHAPDVPDMVTAFGIENCSAIAQQTCLTWAPQRTGNYQVISELDVPLPYGFA